MMRDILYASDFVNKDVLDLASGDLVGTITGLLIEESPLRVAAFAYRNDDADQSGLAFCNLSQVTDIDQQVIVISGTQAYLPGAVKSILGLSCLDAGGTLLGKIRDCAWTGDDHLLTEIVVAKDDAWYGIAASDIARLGSGAVILGVAESGIHKSAYHRSGVHASEDAEEMMRALIRRVGATLSEAGQKVGEKMRQIDTDELSQDINRFTERLGKEIRNAIDTISEQSRSAKYATIESEVISIMRDLDGFTVTAPIYDLRGEVIILPGDAIDEDSVRRIIEAGKVAELYRIAISINRGDDNE